MTEPRPPKELNLNAEEHLRELERLAMQEVQTLTSALAETQRALSAAEDFLDKIQRLRTGGATGIPVMRPTSGPYRYANMTIIDAIILYLKKTERPWTRDHLIHEVLEGGVYAGRGETARGTPQGQAKKSLDYFLLNRTEKQKIYGKRIKAADPKLRQVGELIGLAEWPAEKFKP